MQLKIVVFFFLTISLYKCDGLKILGIFPFPSKSHYILARALMGGLAEKGHNVTVISPHVYKDLPKKWQLRDIVLTGFNEEMEKSKTNPFDTTEANPLENLFNDNRKENALTNMTFAHPNVQKLIHSDDESFDLVIIEHFINNAHNVFSYHYKAPLILFCSTKPNAWVNPLVGNPSPPSYIPEIHLSSGPRMNFGKRLINSLLSVVGELDRNLVLFPEQEKIMKTYFPLAPPLKYLLYNASLVLVNSHTALDQPVPKIPNMIEIGGYHISPPSALPPDLKEWLDAATEGVVYFSMGSILKSKDLHEDKRKAILGVFGKLKQKVLWKWENDVLPGQPKNVKLGKWLPQQGILCHPNVKVFITHGGMLSSTETIYCGVPLLAIPVTGEHNGNAENAATNGYGLKLAYKDITEETLSEALREILTNPKYTQNVKARSKILRDRPINPLDEAIYWIEYVARHQGATHFRSAALDLHWYQYLLLDVITVIALVLGVLMSFVIFAIKICCRCLRYTKMNKDKNV